MTVKKSLDYDGILADLKQGFPYREIAARRKCSTDSVTKIAAANGVVRKPGRRNGVTHLDYDGILADLRQGLTHTEIAARRNCHVASISAFAAACDLARKGGRRKTSAAEKRAAAEKRHDYEDILADLRDGYVYREIAERRGVGIDTISDIAIANGLGRLHRRVNSLCPEQEEQIAQRYGAGESSKVIAADIGVDQTTVLKAIRSQGGQVRGMGTVPRPLRHDAFGILTPEAAYWCGFLFTDGTIVHRGDKKGAPQVSLLLQKRDRGHLVKLRDFLGSDHAISEIAPAAVSPAIARPNGGQGTGAYKYTVTSRQIADRLRALGRYGPAVDPELAASRDFWRGCIDGDGTLGISCGVPGLKLWGSHWLLQAFVDFLGPVSSRRPLNVRPARTIFVVSTGYQTAVKVVGRLYSGATVVLDRKAERAAAILAMDAGRLF